MPAMESHTATWMPAGTFKGIFNGYVVHANRHRGGQGLTAWHTTSFRNAEDQAQRHYWVQDGQFRKAERPSVHATGAFTILTGAVVTDGADAEQTAILKAIAGWSNREQ